MGPYVMLISRLSIIDILTPSISPEQKLRHSRPFSAACQGHDEEERAGGRRNGDGTGSGGAPRGSARGSTGKGSTGKGRAGPRSRGRPAHARRGGDQLQRGRGHAGLSVQPDRLGGRDSDRR